MPAPKIVLEPWPVGQPFPALMTDADLMRVVQLRPAMFYRYKKRGAFKRLEANNVQIGATRYSGTLVEACTKREPLSRFGRRTRATEPLRARLVS